MFFGNSRVTLLKSLSGLCGDTAQNNYVITFIDEATFDYVADNGSSKGPFWDIDSSKIRSLFSSNESCNYLVFDIEATQGYEDYIWPKNNNNVSLPIPQENLIEIFRPIESSELSQRTFFEEVILNMESRWGKDFWSVINEYDKKLIIVVDVSGSMWKSLIQGALDLIIEYATERGVDSAIIDGCQNERWLSWGPSALYDGASADCETPCKYGKKCVYRCTDEDSTCFGYIHEGCIPPFFFNTTTNQVEQSQCPDCIGATYPPFSQYPGQEPRDLLCNGLGSLVYEVDQGTITTPIACNECELLEACCEGEICDICITGYTEDYKCFLCEYVNPFVVNPEPTIGSTFCGIGMCQVTAGTYLGEGYTNSSGEWAGYTGGTGGFINDNDWKDSGGNLIPCPFTHPSTDEILYNIVHCGCEGCGITHGYPPQYDVCDC